MPQILLIRAMDPFNEGIPETGVIAWDASTNWGGAIQHALRASPRPGFFVFVNRHGTASRHWIAAHREFHAMFPFCLAQGAFTIWLPGGIAFDPFNGMPDRMPLPVAVPLNLSLPEGVLDLLRPYERLRDRLDFLTALMDVARAQLIPVHFVAGAGVTYRAGEFREDRFVEECERLREALKTRLPASSPSDFDRCLEGGVVFFPGGSTSELRESGARALKRGFRGRSGTALPLPRSRALLRVRWTDSAFLPDTVSLVSESHAEILREHGIDLFREKESGLSNVRFPIEVVSPFPDFRKDGMSHAEHRILSTTPFSIKDLDARRGDIPNVWVPSRYCEEMVSSNTGVDCVRVIPYWVDSSVFRPDAAARGYSPGRFVILSVGDGSEDSGITILLDAYLEAFTDCDPTLLVLALNTGADAAFARMMREAVASKKRSPAVLVRRVPRSPAGLSRLMASADVYAQTRLDGLAGHAVLQAMACGKPIVAPKAGEYLEMLKPGFAFFLETDGGSLSVSETGSALRWTHENARTLGERGIAARAASETWSIQASAARMAGCLLEIVDQGINGEED